MTNFLSFAFSLLTSLSPLTQSTYNTLIEGEFCACESALTIKGCLALRPQCKEAQALSDILLRAAHSLPSESIQQKFAMHISAPLCAARASIELPQKMILPEKGPKKSNLTLVEFADFRCSHCKEMVPQLKALTKAFPELHIIFLPFPLGNDSRSILAAEAAMAALAVGGQDAFWQMHDLLFEQPLNFISLDSIFQLASKLNLEMKNFKPALTQHVYREKVLALKKLGEDAGVLGTPAFYLNGLRIQPGKEIGTLSDWITIEKSRLHQPAGACS